MYGQRAKVLAHYQLHAHHTTAAPMFSFPTYNPLTNLAICGNVALTKLPS